MQLKQVPFNFSFRLLSDGLFSQHIFSDPEKKTLESLWFLQNFDETMTAGYFLVGGKGGIFPPLTAVFPPFRLAVIIVYYNSSLEGATELKFAPFCSSWDTVSDDVLLKSFHF